MERVEVGRGSSTEERLGWKYGEEDKGEKEEENVCKDRHKGGKMEAKVGGGGGDEGKDGRER